MWPKAEKIRKNKMKKYGKIKKKRKRSNQKMSPTSLRLFSLLTWSSLIEKIIQQNLL